MTMNRQWFDALDHETQADYAEPPPDGPYCVLCVTCGAPLGPRERWSHCCQACHEQACADMDRGEQYVG